MERKFLLYLLYEALILIRGRGNHTKDNFNFELCNFLHNIPLQLIEEPDGKETYKKLFIYLNDDLLKEWFKIVQTGFIKRYPEFKAAN